jgi:hypothetical protein
MNGPFSREVQNDLDGRTYPFAFRALQRYVQAAVVKLRVFHNIGDTCKCVFRFTHTLLHSAFSVLCDAEPRMKEFVDLSSHS